MRWKGCFNRIFHLLSCYNSMSLPARHFLMLTEPDDEENALLFRIGMNGVTFRQLSSGGGVQLSMPLSLYFCDKQLPYTANHFSYRKIAPVTTL